MRAIIVGPKDCTDYNLFQEVVNSSNFKIKTIIYDGSNGFNKLSEKYAKEFGCNIEKFPIKWNDIKNKPENEIKENKFGKYWTKAAYANIDKMINSVDCLISLNINNCCSSLINAAKKAGLKVYIYQPDDEECFGFNFWDE